MSATTTNATTATATTATATTSEGVFRVGTLVYVTDDEDCRDWAGHPLLARVDRIEGEVACLTFLDGGGGEYRVTSLVEASSTWQATPDTKRPPIREATRKEAEFLRLEAEGIDLTGRTLYGARRPFKPLAPFYEANDGAAQDYVAQRWPGEVTAIVFFEEEEDTEDDSSVEDVNWNDMRDPAFEEVK